MRRVGHLTVLIAALVALLFVQPMVAAEAEPQDFGFDSDQWTLDGGRVVDHLGRKALAGTAVLKDVEFVDGVIEVDISMDGRRCFPGILFRAESDADTEVFYLRPHRSKNYSHALQYTPRFKGLTGWQLYSGPGFTANVDIPLDRWVHVKLEIQGTRARVYFDGLEEPALIINDLKRGLAGGFIGLSAPPDGRVHFSNFRLSDGKDVNFGPQPIRAVSSGSLSEWELSQPIAPQSLNRDLAPLSQGLGEIEWKMVKDDTSGLVDVARWLDQAPQLPKCVMARSIITAETVERRKLFFGYSDEISVFLNGRLLFRGDSSFRVRDTEFMGIIGLNDAVVLDLEKGENELVFVVTESFGGWGFMARTEGLRSSPVELADGVTKVWEVTEGLVRPESAVWDSTTECFYVSNINPAGGAAGFGEAGFVSKIDPKGHVLELRWVEGLRGPTGVAVLDGRLYAVERTGVAVIDLQEAKIIDRILIDSEGGFLNDIAVSTDGIVFVTDSGRGVIFRIEGGEGVPWIASQSIAGANGLLVQGRRLITTTMGSESLVTIDLESGTVETIIDMQPFGGDGIMADGLGVYLVSDYTGQLLRVSDKGQREVLIDSREAGISLTDFAFAPELGLVVIPTLRGNSVLAFDLTRN